MSDSPDPSNASRYFKLGLFMLIGVILIVAGVIALGAGALFQHTIPAETLVYESVNGLEVGSPVKYRGVPIGKVNAIIFSSSKYRPPPDADSKSAGKDIRGILIEMALNERAFPGQSSQQVIEGAKQLVGNGLRMRVTPAGISGQSFIDCDILNPTDYPPLPISWKPDVLYIPSAPSSFGQVISAAEQIATELKRANLGRVIAHVDELVVQAKATLSGVGRLVDGNKDNIDRTVSELPETAARLRTTITRADQLLHDPRVDKALGSLSAASESAQAALVDIRALSRDAELLLSGESDDVRSILTDLRRLVSDGAALTDDARQNPSRLLFGKPPKADPLSSSPSH